MKSTALAILGVCLGAAALVSATQAEFPGQLFSEAIFPASRSAFLFQDELPIPSRIVIAPGQSDLTMTLGPVSAKFHHNFEPSPAFGYNGLSPGPTIEVESGQQLRVHWRNSLPDKHVFAPPLGQMACSGPPVRGVTHLHGGVVAQPDVKDKTRNSDGWPDLWTSPGEEQLAVYPNEQSARTLIYHDHALGDTGRNVAAGLLGLYVIHDAFERSLNLPSGAFEIPLVIQAQGLNGDGTRYYTKDIAREFYGNAIAVNGKVYPFLNVEPRKYRFRVVNASNARSYSLKILKEDDRSDGPPIYQIGSDGGFLEKTVLLNDPADPDAPRLLLTPAERADVIVDFSAFAGHNLVLHNNSLDPGDGEIPLDYAMEFRVAASASAPDTSSLPTELRPIPRIPESSAVETRRIVLGSRVLPSGAVMLTLNDAKWEDPVTERPRLGTTEIWELVDTLPDRHPFHMHLVNFQVLDRRKFDKERFKKDGTIVYDGPAQEPDANEMGWKDVVRTEPGMVTRIIVPFGPYPGHYIYHCHILEHEDMDMMRPFEIVAPRD